MKKILLHNKWFIILLLALMIAEPSLNSFLNFWLQRLFNAAVPGTRRIVMMRLLSQGFLIWIVKRLISFSSGTLKARFICNAKRDLKHGIFQNLFDTDVSSLSEHAGSGDYISLFTNDINLIEQRYFNQIIGLMSSIFAIVILGSSFLMLNRKIAIAILAFGTVTMFLPFFFSKRLNQKNILYSSAISRFTQRLKEYIIAYPTIKNFAIDRQIIERFDRTNTEAEDARFEADYELNLANSVGQLLSWFMQVLCVGMGLIMVAEGEIMIGTVIAAQGFANDLGSPLQNLLININNIRSVREMVRRMQSLSESSADRTGAKDRSAERPNGLNNYDICFDHVSLSLSEKTIIHDFSFCFQEGKKYLIVGQNGSGKSSLFKILKRWYHAREGSITIGQTEVDEFTSEQLGSIVSYLNERVNLFTGTVEENITLFRSFTPEAFGGAIKDAQVDLNLMRNIEDEGRNISSGEQRRIEIARSLLTSAKVLIFDEVVSTLDILTAYEIERLALSFSEKTIIFVSHNFSGKLVEQYDEILVLEGGQLIDHGPYRDLIARCPYFKTICEIKFGKFA